MAAPTPKPLPPEICSYAKEPAVHPWTRGRFRAGAGGDGEAAHQSSRPRIRAPAPQHCGTHAIDLRNDRRCIVVGLIGDGQPRGGGDQLVGPGDTLLACPTGVFGERITTIAKKWGCTVEVLETSWGAGVDPEALAARLRADRENKITGILLTHNETSTAVQIDLSAMSRAIGDHPAYVVVTR